MSEKTVKCSCGALMKFSHCVDFKIGGNSGQGLKLLFPEVSETTLPLNVFICPKCAKIELFAPEQIKESLLRVASQRESNVQDP